MSRPLSPFTLQFSNSQGFWVRVVSVPVSGFQSFRLLGGVARTSDARKS
jgi:hypothetical protein